MRKKRQKKIHEEPLINLTPLIDVVFVILFTFIVVAPLLEVDQIQLASGGDGKQSVFENAPVTIHVYSDNSIVINNQKVTLNALNASLKRLQRQYPKGKAHVFHDKEATFGTFQSIKNALETAGFSEMDVVLQP